MTPLNKRMSPRWIPKSCDCYSCDLLKCNVSVSSDVRCNVNIHRFVISFDVLYDRLVPKVNNSCDANSRVVLDIQKIVMTKIPGLIIP